MKEHKKRSQQNNKARPTPRHDRKLRQAVVILVVVPAVIATITTAVTHDEWLVGVVWAASFMLTISVMTGEVTWQEARILRKRQSFYARATTAHIRGYQKDGAGYEFPVFEFWSGGEMKAMESYISANPNRYPVGTSVTLRYNRKLRDNRDIYIPELEPPAININIATFSAITFMISVVLIAACVH